MHRSYIQQLFQMQVIPYEMTELWQFYDSFKCTICYVEYSQLNFPIQLCKNRHMTCLSCLNRLQVAAIDENKALLCPLCKEDIRIDTIKASKTTLEIKSMVYHAMQREKNLQKIIKHYQIQNIQLKEKNSVYFELMKGRDLALLQTLDKIQTMKREIHYLTKQIRIQKKTFQQQKKELEVLKFQKYALQFQQEIQEAQYKINQKKDVKEATQRHQTSKQAFSNFIQHSKIHNQQSIKAGSRYKECNQKYQLNNEKQAKVQVKHRYEYYSSDRISNMIQKDIFIYQLPFLRFFGHTQELCLQTSKIIYNYQRQIIFVKISPFYLYFRKNINYSLQDKPRSYIQVNNQIKICRQSMMDLKLIQRIYYKT